MRLATRTGLVLTALVLVLVACGDDDSTPTTTAGASTTSTAPSPSSTATTATSTAPTGGDQVSALIERFRMTALRTTYLFGEGDDQTEVTLSQDPTADPPVEAILALAANTKLITIGDETIFCDTESLECFTVPGAAGSGLSASLLGPFAGGLFGAGQLGGASSEIVTEEPITVAGRGGVCFTFTPQPSLGFETDMVRQCIDTELGFTLLLQTRETGSDVVETIMELLEYGDPLEEDFTPSGPVAVTP